MSAPRGVPALGVPGGDPPRTATIPGGTHPSGMHSCFFIDLKVQILVAHGGFETLQSESVLNQLDRFQ